MSTSVAATMVISFRMTRKANRKDIRKRLEEQRISKGAMSGSFAIGEDSSGLRLDACQPVLEPPLPAHKLPSTSRAYNRLCYSARLVLARR